MSSVFNVKPLTLPDNYKGYFFIDIEATGLKMPSYPVSIGIRSTQGYASQCLIKPNPNWKNFHMTQEAEKIHKIPMNTIAEHGYETNHVAQWILDLAKGIERASGTPKFFSDNPAYEAMWLGKIFEQFPNIYIGNSHSLIREKLDHLSLSPEKEAQLKKEVREQCPHTHNALDDVLYWTEIVKKLEIFY